MASFFNVSALSGNPFSTPVGQLIEQATDANLASENWSLNMEICDMINNSSDTARDAMKALKKRLSQNVGKNYTVISYTLTVLETCVKNCGRAFHVLVANKEFIQELVKLIGPKNDPPAIVQEKVLSLIQVWADAFKNIPELNGVVLVYQELKNKGIEFPMTDFESTAPIYTPVRSVPENTQTTVQQRPSTQITGEVSTPPLITSCGSINLTQDQVAKLQSELAIVSLNLSIFSEMLTELKPGQEEPADYKLMTNLYEVSKEMQKRIVDLIGRVNHDEITAELLRLNDELNNSFLRYQRYEKNRDPQNQIAPSAILGAAIGIPTREKESIDESKSALIDLEGITSGGNDNLSSRFGKMGISSSELSKIDSVSASYGSTAKYTNDADEFDMLAQSRKIGNETSQTSKPLNVITNVEPLTSGNNSKTKDLSSTYENEFDEIAAWLGNPKDNIPEESLTSKEFEKFLAERAAAADVLPTVPQREAGDINDSSHQKQTDSKKDDKNLLAF